MRTRIRPGGRARRGATIAIVVSIALVLSGSTFGWSAADPGTPDALQNTQVKLADLIERVSTARAHQAALERSLSGVLLEIDGTRRRIESATAQLAANQASEREVRAEAESQQELVDRRAAELYMNPMGSIDVILGSTSLADLATRAQYVDAVARSDQALLGGLARRNAALGRVRSRIAEGRERLHASQAALRAQASSLTAGLRQQQDLVASLDTDVHQAQGLLRKLEDSQARERAAAALRGAGEQATPSTPSPLSPPPRPSPSPTVPRPSPPPPATSSVQKLIAAAFTPLGPTVVTQALCVANHESSFNPQAANPYSGAAGVFQFVPQVWPGLSQAAGYGGRSVFDAAANVGTAAWDVARFGWADWNADGPSCGF